MKLFALLLTLTLLVYLVRAQQIGNVTFGQFGTAYLLEQPSTFKFVLEGGRYVDATYETLEDPVHFVALHSDTNPLLRRCDLCNSTGGADSYNNNTGSIYDAPGTPLDYFTLYLFYDKQFFFNGTLAYKFIQSDLNSELCQGQDGTKREPRIFAFANSTWTELPFPTEILEDRVSVSFDSILTSQLGVPFAQGVNLVVTSVDSDFQQQ